MVDEITPSNYDSHVIDSEELYEIIYGESVAARIFPPTVFNLMIEDKRFEYHKIVDDLKTNYSLDGYEVPDNHLALQPKQVKVPLITAGIRYGRHEKKVYDKGKLPTGSRERLILEGFARDIDMYAIAGESTYNGVAGIADTTNFSTAAGTELDLTTFTTLRSTLNTMITQLQNALKADNKGRTSVVRQNPLILLVTSDVMNRLVGMGSSTDDHVSMTGYDLAMQILMARGGPGSGIEESDMLGATVTKTGNSFYVATAGTTNAALMSQHPSHYNWARSGIEQPMEETNRGYEKIVEQRLVPYSIRVGSVIYSGTVDITA